MAIDPHKDWYYKYHKQIYRVPKLIISGTSVNYGGLQLHPYQEIAPIK